MKFYYPVTSSILALFYDNPSDKTSESLTSLKMISCMPYNGLETIIDLMEMNQRLILGNKVLIVRRG